MAPYHLEHLVALLDPAIKIEHEENRQLRSGCHGVVHTDSSRRRIAAQESGVAPKVASLQS
jgi:hypothetical protein